MRATDVGNISFEYEKPIALCREASLSVNVFRSGNQIQKQDMQHYLLQEAQHATEILCSGRNQQNTMLAKQC